MKYTVMKMEFPGELSQFQEDTLIANFQYLMKVVKQELLKQKEKLNSRAVRMVAKGSGAETQLDLILANITMLHDNILLFFKLSKLDAKTYEFKFASKQFSMVDEKLSFFGKTMQIKFGNMLPEKKLEDSLRKYVFKDMGFKADEVKIEALDVEENNTNYLE